LVGIYVKSGTGRTAAQGHPDETGQCGIEEEAEPRGIFISEGRQVGAECKWLARAERNSVDVEQPVRLGAGSRKAQLISRAASRRHGIKPGNVAANLNPVGHINHAIA